MINFRIIGASNHAIHKRESNDYYATNPSCASDLLKVLPELDNIWEPACGEGHLARIFQEHNKLQKASDIIGRNYGLIEDFLESEEWNGDIITNPPYSQALKFSQKALEILDEGRFYCAFLKITFLEGQKRKEFFKNCPIKYVYVYSKRQKCVLNGDFNIQGSSATCYAWFVWQKGFKGETILRWF